LPGSQIATALAFPTIIRTPQQKHQRHGEGIIGSSPSASSPLPESPDATSRFKWKGAIVHDTWHVCIHVWVHVCIHVLDSCMYSTRAFMYALMYVFILCVIRFSVLAIWLLLLFFSPKVTTAAERPNVWKMRYRSLPGFEASVIEWAATQHRYILQALSTQLEIKQRTIPFAGFLVCPFFSFLKSHYLKNSF
jgi:hypothetical protein